MSELTALLHSETDIVAEPERLPGGATRPWPHLQTDRPVGLAVSHLLQTLVLHRLKVYIYSVLSNRFDPRAQNGCYGLYILAPATLWHIKTHIMSIKKTKTLILRAPPYYRV
jgi:hypothetical protein